MKTKLSLIVYHSIGPKAYDKLTRQLFYMTQPKSVQRRLMYQKYLA